MNLFYQSAFLKALGWALLDSIWQMGVLWLLYVVLTANGKKLESRQRHTIALMSLTGGTLWFVITLVQYCYKMAETPRIVAFFLSGNEGVPASGIRQQFYGWVDPSLAVLSVIYLLVILILFIRLYRQYLLTRKLYTQGLQKAHPEWRAFLQQAAGHLGIKKNVQVWLSSLVDTPLTIGFIKPIILLPVAALNQLNLQQAEAIILHELNHIRRNDYLVNLLIACVDVILFFNPFAKQIIATIRKEREHSCDDMVMQFRYDASSYAQALLMLEQHRLSLPQLAVAATGNNQQLLLGRVKRILTNEPVSAPFQQKLVAYMVSAILIGFIGWYNPGRVIIQTIRQVNTSQVAKNSEFAPASFETDVPKPIALKTKAKQVTTIHLHLAPIMEEKVQEDDQMNVWQQDSYQQAQYDEYAMLLEKKKAEYEDAMARRNQFISVAYVTDVQKHDNTLTPAQTATPRPVAVAGERVYPFVPANSYEYHVIEDTVNPKTYIQTYSDVQAQAALEKALMALQEINWQKVEKELKASGKKLDIVTLQKELKKAIRDVNWKKINEETQAKAALQLARENNELKELEFQKIQLQLRQFQQQQAANAERIKKAQQQIISERLQLQQDAIQLKIDLKQAADSCTKAVKKVVVI